MNEDRTNFNPEDLQNTLEIPAVGGNKEPDGGVFDPWKLDNNGPPEDVLEFIAKSLSGEKTFSEEEEPELQPEEIPAREEVSASQPEMQPVKKGDTLTVPATVPAKEPAPTVGDTMTVPVVSVPDNNEKTETVVQRPEEKEIMRTKASGGRVWPPVLISSLAMVLACCITLILGIMPVIMEHGFAGGMTQIIAPVLNAGEPPACTNVLLVGVDEDGYRTDTMMIATYDVETKKVSIMQLPRDTYVHNNGRVDKKLNSAFYSGIEQLQQEIQMAYGIETHKYVEINLEGFRKLIDAIGGVETVVPFNMVYDDPTQDFHIYLLAKKDAEGNPLPQLLNGDKAEQFVRFRKNNDGSGYPLGDLQRMQAQRQFIMDTVKQMISIDGLKNINELIKIAQENVDTDLSFDEIYDYCTAVLTAQEGSIEFIEAPGAAADLPGGSYFVVDYDKASEVAQKYFYADQKTLSKMRRVTIKTSDNTDSSGQSPTGSNEAEDDDNTTGNNEPTSKPATRPGGTSSSVSRPDDDDMEDNRGSASSREPEPSDNDSSDDSAMSR